MPSLWTGSAPTSFPAALKKRPSSSSSRLISCYHHIRRLELPLLLSAPPCIPPIGPALYSCCGVVPAPAGVCHHGPWAHRREHVRGLRVYPKFSRSWHTKCVMIG